VLDAVKRAFEHEQRDADRCDGDAHVAASAEQQLRARGNAGKLGAERAEVGEDEGCEHYRRGAKAGSVAHEREQALLRDAAHPRPELVVDDQRCGRECKDPEEPVAVLGAQDRVGGDPGGIVVREPSEQARPEHGEERRDPRGSEQPPAAADEMPVQVTPWRRGSYCMPRVRAAEGAQHATGPQPWPWSRRASSSIRSSRV
jgi:hypothetical protein